MLAVSRGEGVRAWSDAIGEAFLDPFAVGAHSSSVTTLGTRGRVHERVAQQAPSIPFLTAGTQDRWASSSDTNIWLPERFPGRTAEAAAAGTVVQPRGTGSTRAVGRMHGSTVQLSRHSVLKFPLIGHPAAPCSARHQGRRWQNTAGWVSKSCPPSCH
jgi:hypothetical protein